MTTQYGFFIDSARCTGCKTCELACKDYKNLTPEVSFRRIYEYAGGDWQEDNGVWQQNVFAYYLSIACNHYEDPACTKVCPSGAMHKREDGFVVVDEDVCIGCRYCHMACPYGAPQYNAAKGHMTKCDGCHTRVADGKKPICVESCPLRALDFGPIEELRAKYGDCAQLADMPAPVTKPAWVAKPQEEKKQLIPFDVDEAIRLSMQRGELPAVYKNEADLTPEEGVIRRNKLIMKNATVAEVMANTTNNQG